LEETTGNEVNHQVLPPSADVDENILVGLLPIIVQTYWGPRSMRQSRQRIHQGIVHRNRPQTIRKRSRIEVETLLQDNHARMSTFYVQQRSLNTVTGIPIPNRFLYFDP
jgi:hypothetical protein